MRKEYPCGCSISGELLRVYPEHCLVHGDANAVARERDYWRNRAERAEKALQLIGELTHEMFTAKAAERALQDR